jgi:peptidoglycan/LPS O-acetylase OafA/YrhL
MDEKKTFLESVHLLRGLAAVLVLIKHSVGWYALPLMTLAVAATDHFGTIGVTMFFAISGFILPYSLHGRYGLGDFGTFILKRLVRLEPVYFVSLAFSVAILCAKTRLAPNGIPYELEIGRLLAHALYLIPFTKYDWLNEVYWTLAIEFQFYLTIGMLFPLVAAALHRRTAPLLVFAFAALASLREALPSVGLLAQAPIFAVGIAAFCYVKSPDRGNRLALIAAGLGACLYEALAVGRPLEAGCAALAGLAIVAWRPGRGPLRYFGDISYSLYVSHYPLIFALNQTVRHYYAGTESPLLYAAAAAGPLLAMALAHVLYKLVEAPTQRLSKAIAYGERGTSAQTTSV